MFRTRHSDGVKRSQCARYLSFEGTRSNTTPCSRRLTTADLLAKVQASDCGDETPVAPYGYHHVASRRAPSGSWKPTRS